MELNVHKGVESGYLAKLFVEFGAATCCRCALFCYVHAEKNLFWLPSGPMGNKNNLVCRHIVRERQMPRGRLAMFQETIFGVYTEGDVYWIRDFVYDSGFVEFVRS